jgi:hypothetical protein
MRVLPWNTFVSVGRVRINFSSFGEPASRFTTAIERSGKWKKEEGKAAHSLVRLKEDPSMYIRMRVLPGNTFVSVGQVRINFSSFW